MALQVDSRVMTPRAESVGLIDHVLAWGRARGGLPWGIAADIGTGSGAIALALATEGNFSRIIATDISAAALDVAKANRDAVSPPVPVEFREGFLLEALGGEPVDAIVSNPPYLTARDVEELPAPVREAEPVELALDGGQDGLGLTWRLLLRAHPLLKPGGLLAVQVDRRRVNRAPELARSAGWTSVRTGKGTDGVKRYLLATPRQRNDDGGNNLIIR